PSTWARARLDDTGNDDSSGGTHKLGLGTTIYRGDGSHPGRDGRGQYLLTRWHCPVAAHHHTRCTPGRYPRPANRMAPADRRPHYCWNSSAVPHQPVTLLGSGPWHDLGSHRGGVCCGPTVECHHARTWG